MSHVNICNDKISCNLSLPFSGNEHRNAVQTCAELWCIDTPDLFENTFMSLLDQKFSMQLSDLFINSEPKMIVSYSFARFSATKEQELKTQVYMYDGAQKPQLLYAYVAIYKRVKESQCRFVHFFLSQVPYRNKEAPIGLLVSKHHSSARKLWRSADKNEDLGGRI